mgnify:CR=1 FL=1|tara:strand:- start:142 stop:1572 length:1431 start_codon:yes stop_codon:yes gene_type:complete
MPRAKKPATKVIKKVVATKETVEETSPQVDVKKLKAALKKELKKELQEQIDESFLMWGAETDEEKETNAFVDMDLLRAEISAEFKKEFDKKLAQIKSIEAGETQALNLSNNLVDIVAGTDGISVARAGVEESLFTINNSGSLAFGNRAPRTSGIGTAHFRMKGAGKSPIPSNGPGSTRGVIVEGDGDDENTFIFRALSTGNRQGFNIGSTGKVTLGINEDKTNSLFTAYNNDNDVDGFNIVSASKYFTGDILKLQNASDVRDTYNFIDAKTNAFEEHDFSVFRVNGLGETYTHRGYFSNSTGYAEAFEWADGNPNNEDRNGLTVAVNNEGQLIDAGDDNETIIGVVVESAAVVGNAGWNVWQNFDNFDEEKFLKYKVVEWRDDSGLLQSNYLASLSQNFALPEDAIIFETEQDGSDLTRPVLKGNFDGDREYEPRLKRGWTLVALKGTVTMFKGQNVNKSWIKIKDLNDELEQRIL